MSDSESDTEATEKTGLMDGHIAEARPDREISERIARKRKTKPETQRTYGSVQSSGANSALEGQPPAPSPLGAGAGASADAVTEEQLELRYGARHVIKLFVPVTLCMLLVVATISSISFYSVKDVYLAYTPFHEESAAHSVKAWNALANSLILLCVIAAMTLLLIALYRRRCYRAIHAWLVLSSLMLLFLFAYLYVVEAFRAYNLSVDWVTLALGLWNFGCAGMVAIHWRAPLRLQQAYLVVVAALMALVFIKYLPEWTTWAVLAVISIWDLVAVLTPRGPLRVLVETAQERNEPIFPALIYSSTVMYSMMMAAPEGGTAAARGAAEAALPLHAHAARHERGDVDEDDGGFEAARAGAGGEARRLRVTAGEGGSQPRYTTRVERPAPAVPTNTTNLPDTDEEKGVKLGLGDFIFYSVLVGKASSYGDWNTTLACFVAILIGLCVTLVLLALARRALPALPVSIAFGLAFYFATSAVVQPFAGALAANQLFL